MYYIFKDVNGDILCTNSKEGYEEYSLIGETKRLPLPHEEWSETEGKWIKNKKCDGHRFQNQVHKPEDMQARIAKLEEQVAWLMLELEELRSKNVYRKI